VLTINDYSKGFFPLGKTVIMAAQPFLQKSAECLLGAYDYSTAISAPEPEAAMIHRIIPYYTIENKSKVTLF